MPASITSLGYQELDPDQYYQLQKKLIKRKGDDRQREFLKVLKDNADFLEWITSQVPTNEGRTLPTFDRPLTEDSFKESTADQEAQMYQLWRDAPPRTACRPSFWASVTLEHIREGKITEATWLAANGGDTKTGEERIDRALATKKDEAGNKLVDSCVRTAFRRMSGLRERGNRSVFVDSTFGRGWWRERIVATILKRADDVAERQSLLDVVRVKTYWEELVNMIVSRGSVFGTDDIQAALINTLVRRFQGNPKTPLRKTKTLVTVCRRFSNLAASREISVLPFSEICGIVDDLLTRVENASSGGNIAP